MTLFFGVMFGVIGSGYLLYGKREYDPWFIVGGIALMVFPYFVSGAPLTLLFGILLMLLPIAKRREWF